MVRRRIFPDRILTSRTERQQPGRAKLREVAHAEQVLADLERAYSRAYLPEQFAIRIRRSSWSVGRTGRPIAIQHGGR